MVLFTVLYKVVLTFKYFVEIVFSMTIQMEATGQYFPVMRFPLYYERWFLLSLHGMPLKRLFVKQFSESSELHRSWCGLKAEAVFLLFLVSF